MRAEAGGRRTNSSITRRVIDGASSASPARDDHDRLDQLLGRRVLEQEAARTGPQRLVDVLVEVERGQDQDPRPLVSPVEQPPGRLETVDVRHPDVHQDHVRLRLPGREHGLEPVGSLADDLDVGLGVEDHPEPGPDEGLVVDDQDLDAHAGDSSGR